jgi:thioredoxin 1
LKKNKHASKQNPKSKKKKISFIQTYRIELIIVSIVIVFASIVTWKLVQSSYGPGNSSQSSSSRQKGLPKMIDLGTTTCVPCKMMVPVMEQLRKEYDGKMIVEFINTSENPGSSQEYGISVIPTQIFYDKNGNELTRHTGFIPKEDVIKTFKDFGINLT